MDERIEHFYDEFSETFLRDYVRGNRRNERQHRFFEEAIPPDTTRALVIGCGSGEGARFIATRVARQASIVAVDISAQNLRLAEKLFNHPRIEYRKLNVVTDPLAGEWELVVLPDVYEHIPRDLRSTLHARLDRLLSPTGRILVSVPTPAAQAQVLSSGGDLQIVDEPVTLDDLVRMARDVRATVTYFAMVSIWRTDDYIYAVLERGGGQCRPLDRADKLPVKGHPRQNRVVRGWRSTARFLGFHRLLRWRRQRRIRAFVRNDGKKIG